MPSVLDWVRSHDPSEVPWAHPAGREACHDFEAWLNRTGIKLGFQPSTDQESKLTWNALQSLGAALPIDPLFSLPLKGSNLH